MLYLLADQRYLCRHAAAVCLQLVGELLGHVALQPVERAALQQPGRLQ